MTHSLIGADRKTYLKIVVVSLLGAIGLVAVGHTARLGQTDAAAAGLRAEAPILKAGGSAIFTTRAATMIR
jgi:hypothetical protein